MKNLLYILACFYILFLTGCTKSSFVGMPNPWIDCGQDLECAKNKAGFNFPVELSNINIRAMKDMIEIDYTINNKTVTLRKSKKYDGKGDISGDYNIYPVNKELSINYIKFKVRGDNDTDKIYVVNFSLNKAHYAIMCDKGLNLDEIWDIYEVIRKTDKNFEI